MSRRNVKAYIGTHTETWRGGKDLKSEQYAWVLASKRNPTYMRRDNRGIPQRFTSIGELEDRGWKTAVIYESDRLVRPLNAYLS
jgi:hypothetical protein